MLRRARLRLLTEALPQGHPSQTLVPGWIRIEMGRMQLQVCCQMRMHHPKQLRTPVLVQPQEQELMQPQKPVPMQPQTLVWWIQIVRAWMQHRIRMTFQISLIAQIRSLKLNRGMFVTQEGVNRSIRVNACHASMDVSPHMTGRNAEREAGA